MARKKKLSPFVAVFCALFFFIVGGCSGMFIKSYMLESYVIPQTEASNSTVATGELNPKVIKEQELSIHFLELGNKYTGDCTFIKVGNIEVLIDAGSKASSVSRIYEYVNSYIEDGVLEYVIVTHAHEDHYAGFATNEDVDSLFDLLNCKTVITFSQTTQTEEKRLYKNFLRELEETKSNSEKQTQVYDAFQCYTNKDGAQRVYELSESIDLEILYHKFYDKETSSSDNEYSVCCMINQNDEKYYLFTGDLEEEGEASLVEEYKKEYGKDLPKAALYKAGHHGSKTSSSELLLSKIQPEIVCVCCCAGSSQYTKKTENQFPTQAFIDRVAVWTKNVYVTTLCIDYKQAQYQSFNGNIVVTSNLGKETVVSCANNTTLLKDTEWFKNNRICPEKWKTA